jgi:N6-L-threonylcarbamoyladenine synthase
MASPRPIPIILALDTSCYTTSVAAMDGDSNVVLDRRHVLAVAAGACGLRQSEAVFQHLKNLPPLLEEALGALRSGGFSVSAVAVASRPRPVPGSYLPVFLAGAGFARAVAAAVAVPLVETSHQEGHLAAALPLVTGPAFLALHISGGTTDLLIVRRYCDSTAGNAPAAIPAEPAAAGHSEAAGLTLTVERLGGSTDLHAGQLVDRVGVALGIPFPAGAGLDGLASRGDAGACAIPSAVRGYDVSFSGPHAAALRFLAAGARPPDVAAATLQCVATSCEKLIRGAVDETGLEEVALVGGVAASAFLRARLRSRLPFPGLIFPPPALCTDNAVGVARAAWLSRHGR